MIFFSCKETGALELNSLRSRGRGWCKLSRLSPRAGTKVSLCDQVPPSQEMEHPGWEESSCLYSIDGEMRLREEKVLSQGHTTDEGKVRGETPGLPTLDPMGQARLKVLVASSPPWEGAGGDHSKEASLIQTPQSIHTQMGSSLHL